MIYIQNAMGKMHYLQKILDLISGYSFHFPGLKPNLQGILQLKSDI